MFSQAARGKNFELYDDPSGRSIDWATAFAGLAADAPTGIMSGSHSSGHSPSVPS
jgi:hypothetical protein